jgi:Trypsin-like peptidase domain
MEKLQEIDRQKDVLPPQNNLHMEELHKPSNFRWPVAAGTGESFLPHLTLHDGGKPVAGKPSESRGIAPHSDAPASKPKSDAPDPNAPEKSSGWTVHKGETLYGKAEHELRSHGKPDAHYSPEDVRKEVLANAERNNWIKGGDAAHSPDEQHRRAQFEAYVKDGKTSHLPKDLNGMVHKSNQDAVKPDADAEGKPAKKPTEEGGKVTPDNKPTDKPAVTPPAAPHPSKVTDIDGRACKVQPTGEQIPTLADKAKGCEYRDPADPKHPENKELADLVKRGKESTVEINVRTGPHDGGKGSGVIIGHSKDGSKVYVATDNHVASPEVNPGGSKAKSREVVMPDGKTYPAQLALKEPGTDRAVLAVDVGAGNADKFKAAEFGDNPGEKGKGVILGFPKDSDSLYAAPANLNGEVRSNRMFGGGDGLLPGEQHNRPQIDMPKTHTEEGVSGAPIFNSRGQAIGLLEGGYNRNPMTGKREFWSYGNPTTKAEVENWLAQIQASQEKTR